MGRSIMHKLSARELRDHIGKVLAQVRESDEAVTIERDGQAVAVLLSIQEYPRLQRQAAWRKNDEAARRIRERIEREVGQRTLPDTAQLIEEGRRERDAALDHLR